MHFVHAQDAQNARKSQKSQNAQDAQKSQIELGLGRIFGTAEEKIRAGLPPSRPLNRSTITPMTLAIPMSELIEVLSTITPLSLHYHGPGRSVGVCTIGEGKCQRSCGQICAFCASCAFCYFCAWGKNSLLPPNAQEMHKNKIVLFCASGPRL